MKFRADTLLIKLQFLVVTGIVAAQVLGKTSVSSMLFTNTFILTICLWLVSAKKRISRLDALAMLIVVGSFISVAVNALITNSDVSFSYLKKLIMFWSTILFFSTMSKWKPNRSTVEQIFRLNTLLAVFLIVMYYSRNSQMHILNNRITTYLTFGFSNPNAVAVFLSAICIIELICIFTKRKLYVKIFHAVLAMFMGGFILETQARNAELLMTFFVAIYLFLILRPNFNARMNKNMAALIATFPLIFALIYLAYIYVPGIQKIFAFLVGEGKNLDSRVQIWTLAIDAIKSSPIFGAYSEISGGTGQSQLHNSHLDVMASYGVGVLAAVCVFLYRVLNNPTTVSNGRIQFICQMGFAALLMSGIGEAMVFSGGQGIYIFCGVILMLANYDFKIEDR